ncbi:thioredoxin family protein [Bacteroidia bacterium]|nr:thioredoxin family protein [Bacteroidia bacterium]MDC1394975.1 thioredoxin family protein [Bacteroidia bacterium]
MKNTLLLLSYIVLIFTACKTTSKASGSDSTSKTINSSVQWYTPASIDDMHAKSTKENLRLFVDVSASWCGYCKKMKKNVYTLPSVINALNTKFVSVSMNGEVGDGKTLYSKYNLEGFPTQLILDSEGNVISRNVGYLDEARLLAFIAEN